MSEYDKEKETFIGYDYSEETVNQQVQHLYKDGYSNFGWKLETISKSPVKPNMVVLTFKRDRKIRNKAELTRLQRKFNALIGEIQVLEQSKVTFASVVAFAIGIIGTAFMTGSVFAVTGGNNVLMIILAIPGFIGWIIPYWVFNHLKKRKSTQVNPIIDEKYDEIYDTEKSANRLL